MKQSKRLLGAALALLLLVSASLPASALIKDDPAAKPRTEELPKLMLAYGAERTTAATGGARWDFGDEALIADAAHPLDEGYRMPVLLRRESVGRIDLSFSLRPEKVTANRWNLSERGNLDAKPESQTLRGLSIEIPATGSYIFEIEAEWAEGRISYLFEFGLAADGTRMALSDLPEDYPPEAALANGDVVFRAGASASGNRDKLDTFLMGVKSETPVSARIAVYDKAENPVIYDLGSDGKEILCTTDRTRDESAAAELRRVTERAYASAAAEWEYSAESGGSIAYLRLIDAAGGKLTIAQDIPVEMAAEAESYPAGTETLSVKLTNNTGDGASCDAAFALEALLRDEWTPVPFDASFPETAMTLPAGDSVSFEIPLGLVGEELVPARYRAVKLVRCGERSLRVSAPFEITPPADRLKLEKPREIGIMIGNGKFMTAATLTLRGRYEGVSPVSYVMKELGSFRPIPGDWRMSGAAETDGASLTLSYADGSEQKLYLDPNAARTTGEDAYEPLTVLTLDGKQYYSDREAYSRVQECAAVFGGKPQLQ